MHIYQPTFSEMRLPAVFVKEIPGVYLNFKKILVHTRNVKYAQDFNHKKGIRVHSQFTSASSLV